MEYFEVYVVLELDYLGILRELVRYPKKTLMWVLSHEGIERIELTKIGAEEQFV